MAEAKELEEITKLFKDQKTIIEELEGRINKLFKQEKKQSKLECVVTLETVHLHIACKNDLDVYYKGIPLKAKILEIYYPKNSKQPQKAIIVSEQKPADKFQIVNWHKSNLFLKKHKNKVVILNKVFLKKILEYTNPECVFFQGRWIEGLQAFAKVQYEFHSAETFQIIGVKTK